MLISLVDIITYTDNHIRPIKTLGKLIDAGYIINYGITNCNPLHIRGLRL